MQAHFASLTSTPLHGPWKPPPTVSGHVLDISYEWNHMVRVTLWVWSSSIILLGVFACRLFGCRVLRNLSSITERSPPRITNVCEI